MFSQSFRSGGDYVVDIPEHVETAVKGRYVEEFPPGAVQRGEQGRGCATHWNANNLSVDAVHRVEVSVVNHSIQQVD